MNVHKYPTDQELRDILRRPVKETADLSRTVDQILDRIRKEGDSAVREYEEQFDHARLGSLRVSEEEMEQALAQVSTEMKQALTLAHANIYRFHEQQKFVSRRMEVTDGVECWQESRPIEKVGLYIPGGTAPLFSTVLMLATPARIAGCAQIVLCTPPRPDGTVHPAILAAAGIAGVSHVFKIGGVQAIGAMAYGTESVPKVYKIFGPGNQYVMCAKQKVSLSDVAIDMPAGPSEVCVLADRTARPHFVASDLLSQAEHGTDSQVILITTCEELIPQVQSQIEQQMQALPRKETAGKALEYSHIILVKDAEEMMRISNRYAPEHLIIETENCQELATKVINAGSVFLGHLTPESAGDYASGTNHTLPTHGYATAYSGVNLDSYLRKITFQHITAQGIRSIGHAVEVMAAGEQLDAHKNAMSLRIKEVK